MRRRVRTAPTATQENNATTPKRGKAHPCTTDSFLVAFWTNACSLALYLRATCVAQGSVLTTGAGAYVVHGATVGAMMTTGAGPYVVHGATVATGAGAYVVHGATVGAAVGAGVGAAVAAGVVVMVVAGVVVTVVAGVVVTVVGGVVVTVVGIRTQHNFSEHG